MTVSIYPLLLICMQEFYPSGDQQKLLELVDTCQLLGTVVEFQQQVCDQF